MKKKEYKKPEVKTYGDVKEITKGGGANPDNMDGVWMTDDAGHGWWGVGS